MTEISVQVESFEGDMGGFFPFLEWRSSQLNEPDIKSICESSLEVTT